MAIWQFVRKWFDPLDPEEDDEGIEEIPDLDDMGMIAPAF